MQDNPIKQSIIISDADAFYKNGNNIGDLLKYIEYHDESNVERGRVVSVFDLLYKDFSEKLWKRKLSMRNVQKNIKFKSEIIIYSILNELLTEEAFRCYSFSHEVRLADIFKKDGIFKNYGIQILRLETHSEVTKDTLKDGLTMLTEINYKVGKHI